MKYVKRLIKYCNNFYIISILVFVVIMLFFAEADIFIQAELWKQKNKLESDKIWYEEKINQLRNFSDFNAQDSLLIEKYAREIYLMKRENEDLYVITKKPQISH